jgi:acyl carrier protein
MTEQEIFEHVKKLIVELRKVDETKVVPEASFRYDLDADSLDFIEFIGAVEEIFGIEVPDADAEKIATVQDAVDYIKSRG